LIRSANIALVSPTHVAARAVALDTDFGLHFLRVRPPASKLDSVRLVGGGRLNKMGKTEFVSSAAARAVNVGGDGGERGGKVITDTSNGLRWVGVAGVRTFWRRVPLLRTFWRRVPFLGRKGNSPLQPWVFFSKTLTRDHQKSKVIRFLPAKSTAERSLLAAGVIRSSSKPKSIAGRL